MANTPPAPWGDGPVAQPVLVRIDESQGATRVSLARVDALLNRLSDIIEALPQKGSDAGGCTAPKNIPTLTELASNSHEIALHSDNIAYRLENLLNRLI